METGENHTSSLPVRPPSERELQSVKTNLHTRTRMGLAPAAEVFTLDSVAMADRQDERDLQRFK